MDTPDVRIFPDAGQLAQAAAEAFVRLAGEFVTLRGVFNVALSGGSTPLALYHHLASEPFMSQVNWKQVHIFWGDERCVPPDHNNSNFRRVNDILLRKVGLPEANIHRIKGELDPQKAAEAYEEDLLSYFPTLPAGEISSNPAGFDLILLGLGDDAHTASLFAGTSAVNEMVRWTAAHYVDKLGAWRVTLTPALINYSANIWFLVSGITKREALQKVLYGTYQPDRYPAQVIKPKHGSLIWLVDEEAASLF